MPTLPREPWRGSQICGYLVEDDAGCIVFCGERKAEGLPFCFECAEHFEAHYGGFNIVVADCVALGCRTKAVRLLWEPCDGGCPEEPTGDETAAYAALLAAS